MTEFHTINGLVLLAIVIAVFGTMFCFASETVAAETQERVRRQRVGTGDQSPTTEHGEVFVNPFAEPSRPALRLIKGEGHQYADQDVRAAQ